MEQEKVSGMRKYCVKCPSFCIGYRWESAKVKDTDEDVRYGQIVCTCKRPPSVSMVSEDMVFPELVEDIWVSFRMTSESKPVDGGIEIYSKVTSEAGSFTIDEIPASWKVFTDKFIDMQDCVLSKGCNEEQCVYFVEREMEKFNQHKSEEKDGIE